MDKTDKYALKTGEKKIVDDWVNKHYPESAKRAIATYLPDYQHIARLRNNAKGPRVSSLNKNVRFVLNYNENKKCFIVWNAAIQRSIHHPDSKDAIVLSFGTALEERLHQHINSNSVSCVYQDIRDGGPNRVELVLIVGNDALEAFLRNYRELLKPNPADIPKGKSCVYAVAGGEIEYIQAE